MPELTLVGMVLERQLAVSLLQLILCRGRRDAEDLIVPAKNGDEADNGREHCAKPNAYKRVEGNAFCIVARSCRSKTNN